MTKSKAMRIAQLSVLRAAESLHGMVERAEVLEVIHILYDMERWEKLHECDKALPEKGKPVRGKCDGSCK